METIARARPGVNLRASKDEAPLRPQLAAPLPSPWGDARSGRTAPASAPSRLVGSASDYAHQRAPAAPGRSPDRAALPSGKNPVENPVAGPARLTAAPSLDTPTNNLSPRSDGSPPAPALSGVPAPRATGTTRTDSDRQRSAAKRDGRHQLRDVAVSLAQGASRVCLCGRQPVPTAAGVEVKRSDSGRAYFAGLLSCGSAWTCPVCAEKIGRKRQEEVSAILTPHLAAGGTGLFLTLTVPHDQGQPLRELRATVAAAWSKLLTGKSWQLLQGRYGLLGWTRRLEVTHGRAGFHPHLHVLLFCDRRLSAGEQQRLHAALFGRWAREVERRGLRAPLPGLCPMQPIYSADVADYLTKIAAVLELTRTDGKGGRGGNRSPFQVLSDYGTTRRPADAAIWREWAEGMKGARQLTFSKGLRERYAVEETTDEEIAGAEVGGETVLILSRPAWKHICRVPMLRADVLRAAERGGPADVLELLDSLPSWPADAAVTVLTRAGPLRHAA